MDTTIMDGKINLGCQIAIKIEDSMLSLLRGDTKIRQAYIYCESGKLFLTVFFPLNDINSMERSLIKRYSNTLISKEMLSISQELSSSSNYGVLTELLNATSVIVSGTFLEGNELNMVFRFHKNFQDNIMNILATANESNQNFRIVKIKRTLNFRERMDKLNNKIPLKVLQISYKMSAGSRLSLVASVGGKFITEVEGRSFTEEGVRCVLFSEKKLNFDFVQEISSDERIYEFKYFGVTFEKKRNEVNKLRIPRTALLVHTLKDRAYITSFFPAEESDSFSQVIARINNSEEAGVRFEIFSPLNGDVWKWI